MRLHTADLSSDDAIKLPQHKNAAQQVLHESKAEVAAALAYAHEVCCLERLLRCDNCSLHIVGCRTSI